MGQWAYIETDELRMWQEKLKTNCKILNRCFILSIFHYLTMFINYLKYYLDIASTTAPKRIFACIKILKTYLIETQ